jgi:hypothetical protein
MKKKYRDIIVNGEHYGWAITDRGDEETGERVRIKIWNPKKVVIYDSEIKASDMVFRVITPRDIRELILELK